MVVPILFKLTLTPQISPPAKLENAPLISAVVNSFCVPVIERPNTVSLCVCAVSPIAP